MNTHRFWMPEYLPAFACKMGSCRSACCEGWKIGCSLADYFRISGLECSPEMREKLDRGLRISLTPTPEAYAEMAPRYDGNCYMRLPDGRCALHAEIGEEALPTVCRLYPRGIRRGLRDYEIALAGSCEAVVELLWERKEPIRLLHGLLPFELPPLPEGDPALLPADREVQIEGCLACLQKPDGTLPQRILALAELLKEPLSEPSLSGEEVLQSALRLLERIEQSSRSLRSVGVSVGTVFREDPDKSYEAYTAAIRQFTEAFPDGEDFLARLLANHLFFVGFPFGDRPGHIREKLLSVCVIYSLLRLLCAGIFICSPNAGREEIVDCCAAAFRLIEHTDFERRVSKAIEHMGDTRLCEPAAWLLL